MVDINIAGIATIKVNVENKYTNVQKIYQYLCDKSSYLESVFDSMTSIDILSDIDTIDKKIVSYYHNMICIYQQQYNWYNKNLEQNEIKIMEMTKLMINTSIITMDINESKKSMNHIQNNIKDIINILTDNNLPIPELNIDLDHSHDINSDNSIIINKDLLVCPITYDIFKEPVVLSDGHTYEKEAIVTWLKHKSVSPMTNLQLSSKSYVPNQFIKSLLAQ